MIVYWLLMLPIAVLAYGIGSMSTMVLASNFVFRRSLSRLGKGNVWISNFRRVYGVKGAILLLLIEAVKDLLPVFIGGLLLSIKGHADVGRAFACFCLVMGRLFPVYYELKGSHASLCIVFAPLLVDSSVGLSVLVVMGLVTWFTKQVSMGAVAGALLMIIVSLLVIDDSLVMRLLMFTSLAVIIKHIPAIIRVFQGREEKFSLVEDLTYKLDGGIR